MILFILGSNLQRKMYKRLSASSPASPVETLPSFGHIILYMLLMRPNGLQIQTESINSSSSTSLRLNSKHTYGMKLNLPKLVENVGRRKMKTKSVERKRKRLGERGRKRRRERKGRGKVVTIQIT